MQGPLVGLRFIHNAIRQELTALEEITGRLDAADRPTRQALGERIGGFGAFLKEHEAGEEDVFYPAIEEKAPHVVRAYEMDHRSFDAIMQLIEREGERALGPADGPEAVRALHQAAATLRATMSLHLTKEEDHLVLLAEQLLDPGEQARVVGQMAAHTPREMAPPMYAFIFTRLGDDDREGFLRVIQAVAPAPAFQGVAALVSHVLPAPEWAALTARIPSLAPVAVI